MASNEPKRSDPVPRGPTAEQFGDLAGQPPKPSRVGKWLWRLATVVVVVLTVYLFRAPILRGAARAYVVDDDPTKADAIVVLGGGANTRPFAAAKLFHEGYARRVLILNTEREPADELGASPSDLDLNRRVLRALKVPDSAVTPVGQNVSSTYDEALAVREWAQRNGAKRILVPTDAFHTRRVKWLFGRMLRPLGADVSVRAIPPRKYSTANWWQHEEGLIGFQNEVIKFTFYHWKYWTRPASTPAPRADADRTLKNPSP